MKPLYKVGLVGLVLSAILVSACSDYGYRPCKGYSNGYKGHPHGAPPGQAKKYYSGGKKHPHGIPPGQAKKYRY